MGGNQSYQFDEKLFHSQWERKQGSAFDGRTIWINKSQPNREIQQYPVYADTQDQIDIQRELFSLRKDSAQLVSATHLKQTVRGGLCSSSAQALQHIPFPDILHVYFNALTGYKRLNRAVGPFRPGSEQIGFNNQGQAKVWMNTDFSSSAPTSKVISQVEMVRILLQMIQDVTDLSTTPRDNPSIMNYIYRNNNDVNFDQALSAIKEFANMYNGGIIPKNLECLHKVGIENISRTITTPSKESMYYQTQRSNLTSGGVLNQQYNLNQQQPPINQTLIDNQYRPLQNVQTSILPNSSVYQRPQVVQNNMPTYKPVQSTQPIQPVQVIRPPVQVVQQPTQIVQQPIQFVQQPIQNAPVSQPVQILGASNVRVENANFVPVNVQPQSLNQGQQRFLQSQVHTVRPIQPVFVRPQEQRVIQQVIRTPQGPIQVLPQSQIIGEPVVTTSLEQQGSRISQQQNVYNQVPIVQQVNNQVPPVRQNLPVNQVQQLNFQNDLPEEPKFQNINKQSQVQILNQLQKQTSRQSQIYQLSQQNRENLVSYQTYETQFIPRNRNFIDSNTMSIGIDRANSQQLQSYSTSPEKSQVQKNYNLGSSKFNNLNLQDGKSSQALLAQLRSFTSSKKDIPTYNAYEFSSNTYTSSNYTGNYDFTNKYTTAQQTTQQPEDIYATFNKYAKNNTLDQNIQMKYSMTKNLYEQPVTTTVQYEQNGYNLGSSPIEGQFSYNQDIQKFQQQGQYHVDYDPQILADIQRLKN